MAELMGKIQGFSDRKKFNVIGEFCFTLKRSTKKHRKVLIRQLLFMKMEKKIQKNKQTGFWDFILRALKKDPTQSTVGSKSETALYHSYHPEPSGIIPLSEKMIWKNSNLRLYASNR